ncbi:MAG: hypothetical protein QGG63_00655 [Candidatus Pacebacteria bacterium]|jgi:hypothetical protein|nr:hypothetical protein [Candidatus Paceibacterota bacterium]|tara:strand:- start:33553 stop:34248 length:696 start_codon:yes stop_codon:yes gene_type:complete
MEGFELENINKEEGEKKESGTASTDSLENYRASLEEIKEELKLEEIEEKLNDIQSLSSFLRKEKEALEEKKESRTKTFLRKAFIGATLMAFLLPAVKMGVSKAEASESNTQTEQQENQEEKTFEQMGIEMADDVLLQVEVMKIQAKVADLEELRKTAMEEAVKFSTLRLTFQKIASYTENLEKKETAEKIVKDLDKTISKLEKFADNIGEKMENLLKEAKALVSQHKSKNR